MLGGNVQHSVVDCRIFVPSEAYVTNLARFLGSHNGHMRSAGSKIAIRISMRMFSWN
jgi:hypothetical protein